MRARNERTIRTPRCASCEWDALPPFDVDALVDRVRHADAVTTEQVRSSTFPARCPAWWRAIPGPAVACLAVSALAFAAFRTLDPLAHPLLVVASVAAFLVLGVRGVALLFFVHPPAFPRSRKRPPDALLAYLRAMQAGKFALAWEYVLPAARNGSVHRPAFEDVHVPACDVDIESPASLGEYWRPLVRRTGCGYQSLKMEGFGTCALRESLEVAICRLRIQHVHTSAAVSDLARNLLAAVFGALSWRSTRHPTRYVWIAIVMREVGGLWYAAQTDFVVVEPAP